uniref:Uncharacterized protein n=1 Tax=Setaria viridis TaxID=4556 RepID=A0A4U6TMJ3_SETVI|nr:hypothetical protein SEVIR_7G068845v2 [Setaria viridis]
MDGVGSVDEGAQGRRPLGEARRMGGVRWPAGGLAHRAATRWRLGAERAARRGAVDRVRARACGRARGASRCARRGASAVGGSAARAGQAGAHAGGRWRGVARAGPAQRGQARRVGVQRAARRTARRACGRLAVGAQEGGARGRAPG